MNEKLERLVAAAERMKAGKHVGKVELHETVVDAAAELTRERAPPMTEGEALAVRFDPDPIQNDDSRIWTYMIDIGKHGAAVECHGETRELALTRAQAVFAAITAHTAASGGEVAGWLHEIEWLDGWGPAAYCPGADKPRAHLETVAHPELSAEILKGERFTPLYTAPPAAVPADALERLVEKWQGSYGREKVTLMGSFAIPSLLKELAALIPKGAV